MLVASLTSVLPTLQKMWSLDEIFCGGDMGGIEHLFAINNSNLGIFSYELIILFMEFLLISANDDFGKVF